MSRLKSNMSVLDIITTMSEGNPGALTCLLEMMQKTDWYSGLNPVIYLMMLDTIDIYGSKLYMLWNDCCNRDLNTLELVIRNWQMGKLTREAIISNVSQGYGTPFVGLKTLDELFGGGVK